MDPGPSPGGSAVSPSPTLPWEALEALARRVSMAVCKLAADGTLRHLNAEGERATGFRAADLEGRPWWTTLYPDEGRALEGWFRALEPDGTGRARLLVHTDPSGRPHTLLWLFLPKEVGADGVAWVGFGLDPGRQERLERNRLEDEDLFHTLLEAAPDAILWLSGGRFLGCNRRTLDVFGCTADEMVLKSPLDFSPPFQPDGSPSEVLAEARIREAMEGHSATFEWLHRRCDGTPFMAEVTLARAEVGGEAMLQAIVRDISRRKRAEETLRASEARHRRLLENLGEGILLVDDARVIRFANPAAERIFGTPDGMVGRPLQAFFTPEAFARVEGHIRLRSEGITTTYEVEIVRPDGECRTLLITGTAHRDQDQRLEGTIGILRDITETRRADASLRRLTAAIDQSPDGILVADGAGEFQYANPALERMEGLQSRDLRAALFDNGEGPWTPEQRAGIREALAQGEAWRGHLSLRPTEETPLDYQVAISCVRDARGKVQDTVTTVRDVTREAELERQLRHAQKMEALGVMAGGIAHDFNNILMPILCYAEMAHLQADAGKLVAYMDQIERAARRAKDLVEHLLSFSRAREQEAQPVALGPILKEGLKLIRAALPARIEIRQDIQDAGRVRCVPGQIHQVVMNLCTNAGHAMQERGGILGVQLLPVALAAPLETRSGPLPAGAYLRLTIRDTGHGMDAATLDRIFLPFFTTKPEGVGTGLGLAIVHGILAGMGGGIQVESRPGEGTAFHLYLPRHDAEKGKEGGVSPLQRGREERVLVVDDEPSVRAALEEALVMLGYRPGTADSGEAALERLRGEEAPWDLLLADLNMPGLSGLDLLKQVRAQHPGLPCLLMSGQATEQPDVLRKPPTLASLGAALRKMLDGS